MVNVIDTEILPPIRGDMIDRGVTINEGAASALAMTWSAMQANVLTAIMIIFLLLVILLRNFILPMIILLAIPVAAKGGIGGLAILNLSVRQPLDMLTMLGFVILTGLL